MSENGPPERDHEGEERPVPPGDRLAHLGRIEHPVEMYPITRMIGPTVDLDSQSDATAWADALPAKVAAMELKQLFEDFHEPLVRFCITLTRDMAAAEELAKAVFVRAAEEGAPNGSEASVWLWQTARRLYDEDFLRKCGVRP